MKLRLATLTLLVFLIGLFNINADYLLDEEIENIDSAVLSHQGEEVLVTRVIDGDTIEIEGGKTIRYIGIDTPETKHPEKGLECFGKEATEFNRRLIEGKAVRLEKDVSETDRYGRLLRYVYFGDTFVNEELVKQGYAHVSTYPPDVKFQDTFLQAQEYARENFLGLWGMCN